jgi:hypothetical protein
VYQNKHEVICKKWHTLLCKIDRKGIFEYELFKNVFSETFDVLQLLSGMPAVPKECMEVFLAADRFARHFVTGISKEHDAAGELTGRMLWDCGMICNDNLIEGFFDNEIQKAVCYKDVDEAVAVLAEKYAKDYD